MRIRNYLVAIVACGITLLTAAGASAAPMTIDRVVPTKSVVQATAQVGNDLAVLRQNFGPCSGPACSSQFTISMLGPDGSADTSWGQDGTFRPPSTWGEYFANSLIASRDGSLVLIGMNLRARGVVVGRISATGSADLAFGKHGLLQLATKARTFGLGAASVCPDGALLLTTMSGSSRQRLSHLKIALRKFDAHGVEDPTFGNGRPVDVTNLGSTPTCVSGDRIIVAGGMNFVVVTVFGSANPARRMAKHVAVRTTRSNAASLYRLEPDGARDSTFGAGGKIPVGGAHGPASIGSIYAEADGHMLLSYEDRVGLHVRRLGADGTLDGAFGAADSNHGIELPGINLYSPTVRELPDGRLFATGLRFDETATATSAIPFSTWVALINADGTLDRSAGVWLLPPRTYSSIFASNAMGVLGGQPVLVTSDTTRVNKSSGFNPFGPQRLTFLTAPAATADDVTPPSALHVHRSKRLRGAARAVHISWSRGSDVGTGVNYYEAQLRYMGSVAWSGFGAKGLLRRYSSTLLEASARVEVPKQVRGLCVRVRAYDRDGNRGPWSRPRCDRLAARS